MNVSKKEYSKMAGDTSPASPIWKDLFMAFIFGGAICTLGQLLCQIYMTSFRQRHQRLGLRLEKARLEKIRRRSEEHTSELQSQR